MKCPKCQVENPPTKRFCYECGTKLPHLCPHCGSDVLPNETFCGECGGRIAKPDQGISPPQPNPVPIPHYLAEKILTSRRALEGERRQVTVLFADLKGSMELIADRDPEEARRLLEPIIERMTEAVHHYEGTLTHIIPLRLPC